METQYYVLMASKVLMLISACGAFLYCKKYVQSISNDPTDSKNITENVRDHREYLVEYFTQQLRNKKTEQELKLKHLMQGTVHHQRSFSDLKNLNDNTDHLMLSNRLQQGFNTFAADQRRGEMVTSKSCGDFGAYNQVNLNSDDYENFVHTKMLIDRMYGDHILV